LTIPIDAVRLPITSVTCQCSPARLPSTRRRNVMTPPMPALFLADSRGLDFVNSVATSGDGRVDWLADGDGLLDWLGQGQLVPADALGSVRDHALPGELDRLAGQARALREWFRGFVREHAGAPLTGAALAQLAPLNELLERDGRYGAIVADDAG